MILSRPAKHQKRKKCMMQRKRKKRDKKNLFIVEKESLLLNLIIKEPKLSDFQKVCVSNLILGSAMELKNTFNNMIYNFFIHELNLPHSLVILIEEYCNLYHYVLHMNKVHTDVGSVIVEICNLFVSFLSLYFLQKSETIKLSPLLEIRKSGNDAFCFKGISTYRIVVERENVRDIVKKGWRTWKGETRHTICDCYFKTKAKKELIEIFFRDGIDYMHYKEVPYNSFLKLIYILSPFFDHVKMIKSSISLTFFG